MDLIDIEIKKNTKLLEELKNKVDEYIKLVEKHKKEEYDEKIKKLEVKEKDKIMKELLKKVCKK